MGGLTYPLLADFHPKGEVVKAYGLWREERGYSRRAIVVIDREGFIRHSHVYERGAPDMEEVLAIVRSLEAA